MTNAEKIGRKYAPKVSVELYKQEDTDKYAASISIGDLYYETDPYGNQQDAFEEACGYLKKLSEQIDQAIYIPF